ncbi:MAG: ABC transporter permease [Candidatus Acidiferrales bacterium]
MRLLRRFFARLSNSATRRQRDERMREEIEEHLAMQTAENLRAGLPPAEARRQAILKFGAVEAVKESYRAERRMLFIETLVQDIRYGLRMLRKSPSFTAVAVLTLALGIGANTAIFSMVDSILLRPSPVPNAGQVATLATEETSGTYSADFSYPDLEDIRKQSTAVFSDVAASMDLISMDGLSVEGNGQPICTSYVTGNFFRTMGVKPALGTFIEPKPGKSVDDEPVLVLSYAYWKAHFGGDAQVVGKSVLINGHPVTIIGVAPKGFHGISPLLDMQGYLPLGMALVTGDAGNDFVANRKLAQLGIYTRLKPGVTLASAQPELNVIAHRLSAQYPEADKWMSLLAFPLSPLSPVDDPSSLKAILLTGTFFLVLAALVLLLACLNVANLLLARASVREREMALRAAVGARRSRLVRQLLTESLLLALLGCAGGIVLGLLSSNWLGSINLKTTIPLVMDFQFDWRVFAYAFGTALLTGIVVGIAPALRATRGNLNDLLHASGRTATARRQRARSVLVVAQVGGSLALLIVAGLFVRSLRSVEHSNLGFDPNDVLNFSLDAHQVGYNEAQGRDFLQNLLPRVRALPGVQTASLAGTVPMGYAGLDEEVKIEGYQPPPGQSAPSVSYNVVSPEYFETMHIPVVRGRGILDSDSQSAAHVAVINEAMAEKYWRGEDPIGRHFTSIMESSAVIDSVNGDDPKHSIEVVGIAKNSKTHNLHRPVEPYMYLPLAQQYHTPVTLQLRTSLPLGTMNREVVGLIHSLAPAMPVFDVQTMTEALDTLGGLRLYEIGAGLAASLGILGLALAVVGVYGVVSCAASQRTHEIGIRMALGAQPKDVLRMIFGQGFVIVGAGLAVGVLAAAGIGRVAGNFLFGISPLDPLTYVSASLSLAAVALAACYIPARRAMGVDPMIALRHE